MQEEDPKPAGKGSAQTNSSDSTGHGGASGGKPGTGASGTIAKIIRDIVEAHAGKSQVELRTRLTEAEFEMVKIKRAVDVLREDRMTEREGSRAKDTTIRELTEQLAKVTATAEQREAEALRLSELIQARDTGHAAVPQQIETHTDVRKETGRHEIDRERLEALQEDITLLQSELRMSEEIEEMRRAQTALLEERLETAHRKYKAQVDNLSRKIDELERELQEGRQIENKLRLKLTKFAKLVEPDGKSPNLFGKVAVRLHHCQPEDIEDALQAQEKITNMGLAPPKIGEILVDKGHITPEAAKEVLRVQSSRRPRLEGYRFIRKLGEGLLGPTYQAKQLSLDRDVAVKILQPELAWDEEYIASFLNQAKLVGKLHHKNIARVIDAGETNGVYYYITEYVRGKNLRQVLRKKRNMTERQVFHVGLEVSFALAEAHTYGIVHGDVRPSNIIISIEGTTKLCDFGISKCVDLNTEFSMPVKFYDRVYYTPPEVIRGAQADIRSDIYSLGATLFILATGTFPFGKGRTPKDSLLAHLTNKTPDVRERNPQVRPEVAELIMRMLEPEPMAIISSITKMLKKDKLSSKTRRSRKQ